MYGFEADLCKLSYSTLNFSRINLHSRLFSRNCSAINLSNSEYNNVIRPFVAYMNMNCKVKRGTEFKAELRGTCCIMHDNIRHHFLATDNQEFISGVKGQDTARMHSLSGLTTSTEVK